MPELGLSELDLPGWDFSGYPEYGNLQKLNPESFAPSYAPNTQLVSIAEVAPLQTILAARDSPAFLGQQANVPEPAGQRSEPRLTYFSEAPSGSTTDQLAVSLPSTAIETFEGAGLTLPINQQTRSIAEADQYEGHAQLPARSARVGSAMSIEHTADLPHMLTTYKRSDEPPQNAEGKMICKHIECSNLTFTRRSDWR